VRLRDTITIRQARLLLGATEKAGRFIILVDEQQHYSGIARTADVMDHRRNENDLLSEVDKITHPPISSGSSLKTAARIFESLASEALAVIDLSSNDTTIVTHRDLIDAYAKQMDSDTRETRHLDLKTAGRTQKKKS
jgi:CIC family chloride channel protein